MQCLSRKIQCPNAPNGLGSVYDERYNVQMHQMVWAQTDNPNPPLKDWLVWFNYSPGRYREIPQNPTNPALCLIIGMMMGHVTRMFW